MDRDREASARQLILLGALLGSRELRETVGAVRGWNDRISAACNDVCGASLGKRKNSLKAVLEEVGVLDWDGNQNPIDLIVDHVEADGEIGRLLEETSVETVRMIRSRHGRLSEKLESIGRFRRNIYRVSEEEGFLRHEEVRDEAGQEAAP